MNKNNFQSFSTPLYCHRFYAHRRVDLHQQPSFQIPQSSEICHGGN